jgi:PKD repeat protein
VAPLAVFFDASGTTSPLTSNPFHNIEYRWDFGERDVKPGDLNRSPPITGATNWATGSRGGDPLNLRNSATGAVAAHVFESPGTYTVTVICLGPIRCSRLKPTRRDTVRDTP